MPTVTIRLLKPGKQTIISYQGEVLQRDSGRILVRAPWGGPALDLGFVMFMPGDIFFEHFFADRWYNIFEIQRGDGQRKGWYCNITRPAIISDRVVESEDLELDLFVAPDLSILRLDEAEFAARQFAEHEPATHAAALAALAELEQMVRTGVAPFGGG